MDAGEDTWGFELVDIYGNAITNWQGLSLSYLPLKDGASYPGTNANMGIGEIRSKWVEDDEANWINVGMKKNGLPSGARIRINAVSYTHLISLVNLSSVYTCQLYFGFLCA